MTEYEGVKRSKTEQLRQLLDDRGVKWKALSDRQEGDYTITATRWHDDEGNLLTMCICEPDGSTWDFFWYPSPEQAIEATLGRGTCRMELPDLRGPAYTDVYVCSECGGEVMVGTVMGVSDVPKWCPWCGRKVEQ